MKRTHQSLLTYFPILLLAGVATSSLLQSCWADKLPPAKTPATKSSTTLGPSSYLQVKGKDFVDRTGKVVRLRGVNIGGWLVTEGWMCGQTDDKGRFALEQLEARFGPEKAAKLMNVWYDNWFTSRDLDVIKGYGFNVIRVPFSYRTLQDASGNWKRNPDGSTNFSRMDWVVREAARRGIYVVFDLHIWAGQKEGYSTISRLQPEGDAERAKAAAVWSEVAQHYKGNGVIAAFDVINEPEGSPGDTLQRAMTEAIRAQDPERIVMGESMYFTNFKDPYWKNAVYSAHYPVDEKLAGTAEEKVASWEKSSNVAGHEDVQAPVFIGEMKAPEDNKDSAVALAEAMNRRGWSWAVWCYKGANVGGWASFNYDSSFHYDLANDSYDTIYKKWSTELTQWQDPSKPKNYYIPQWWIDGFKQGATSP